MKSLEMQHGRHHQLCPAINPQRIKLSDPKGGDMSEWDEELRVRQFPKSFEGAHAN